MTPRFSIGTQFMTLAKHPNLCTVVDILTTTNSKGEVLRIAYEATHSLMGQTLTDHNVSDAAIARGIARLNGKPY